MVSDIIEYDYPYWNYDEELDTWYQWSDVWSENQVIHDSIQLGYVEVPIRACRSLKLYTNPHRFDTAVMVADWFDEYRIVTYSNCTVASATLALGEAERIAVWIADQADPGERVVSVNINNSSV